MHGFGRERIEKFMQMKGILETWVFLITSTGPRRFKEGFFGCQHGGMVCKSKSCFHLSSQKG
jgi:hypothetical protein